MMQYSNKTFGSQNAIKQLYRQYSTTFKNPDRDKNKPMTQSSNLPFDKIYSAFNSAGNMKSFGLERFKHSQAKSIIQKLMQTKQLTPKQKQDDLFLNQLQYMNSVESRQPIPLNQTEVKIFCEVVNLITEIGEINQQSSRQEEELMRLKVELKAQGVELPDIEEKRIELNSNTFKRLSKQELETIYEENLSLQQEIDKITKELANSHNTEKQSSQLQSVIQQNSVLKKELSHLKSQILNAGQFQQQQIHQLMSKIQQLKSAISNLQQKRLGKLTDRDDELKVLKQENQSLRLKTIELLKNHQGRSQQSVRRNQLISMLRQEEGNKVGYVQEMNALKAKHEVLMSENSMLKRYEPSSSVSQYEGLTQLDNRMYDGPLQVQSKVSPFNNPYSEYMPSYNADKQNYQQKWQTQRNRNPISYYQGRYQY